MQTQKEQIRNVILDVARAEFSEKGFKNASMRNIANKAEVGLSNIYNYFKNKNEIFCETLSCLLKAIDDVVDAHNSPEHINLDIFSSKKYMRSQINMFAELIGNYNEDFKLLLFKSSGSSLENYREQYIESHTQIGMEYIALMKQKYPDINSNISEFFIHTMSSWWMSIISELVMHDLSQNQLENFIREYMEFAAAGWKKLLHV